MDTFFCLQNEKLLKKKVIQDLEKKTSNFDDAFWDERKKIIELAAINV